MAAKKRPAEPVRSKAKKEEDPSDKNEEEDGGQEDAPEPKHAGWAGIITVIRRPLQLLALVILVVESILIGFTKGVTGTAELVLIVLTAAVLPLAVIGVLYVEIRKTSLTHIRETHELGDEARQAREGRERAEQALAGARREMSDRVDAELHRQAQELKAECQKQLDEQRLHFTAPQTTFSHDVFISTPMAALDDDEQVKRHRADIEKVRHALRDYCHFALDRVFYAGTDMDDKGAFERSDMALRKNYKELEQSRVFLMIAPDKRPSSIYVEAGMAMALGKPCVFFAREQDDLPWLIREATAASKHDGLPSLKVYEYKDVAQIIHWFQQEGDRLFD